MLLVGLHPSSKSPNFMQITQVGFYGCLLIYHRGRNIRFRNPVTFIAVRSKLDIFQGETLPYFSRLFATNTALRNGPGEEHRGLTIFWQNQKKKVQEYSGPMEDYLYQHRDHLLNQLITMKMMKHNIC